MYTFRRFLEDKEGWDHKTRRQYGNETFNHQGDKPITCNPVKLKTRNGIVSIPGSQTIELQTSFKLTDPNDRIIGIKLLNFADPKDKIMPQKGHGIPNPDAGGNTIWLPKKIYLYMIQPGPAPSTTPPAEENPPAI